jgi:hypothetical protein
VGTGSATGTSKETGVAHSEWRSKIERPTSHQWSYARILRQSPLGCYAWDTTKAFLIQACVLLRVRVGVVHKDLRDDVVPLYTAGNDAIH